MVSFSVVIPTFNSEAHIEKAIFSCKNQSLQAKEIIIVDDNSKDSTIKIAKQLCPSIKIIQLDVNKGPAYARNKGWDAATGDYLVFLDSDDEWHPQKLSVLNGVLKQHPEIELLFHPYTLKGFEALQTTQPEIKKTNLFNALLSNPAQTSCLCIKTQINQRFNPGFRYCEDHELLLRLVYQLKNSVSISLQLTKLNRPQLSPGGLSGEKWKMRKGELKMYLNTWKLNPLFFFLIPFLLLFSSAKYVLKLFR